MNEGPIETFLIRRRRKNNLFPLWRSLEEHTKSIKISGFVIHRPGKSFLSAT